MKLERLLNLERSEDSRTYAELFMKDSFEYHPDLPVTVLPPGFRD